MAGCEQLVCGGELDILECSASGEAFDSGGIAPILALSGALSGSLFTLYLIP